MDRGIGRRDRVGDRGQLLAVDRAEAAVFGVQAMAGVAGLQGGVPARERVATGWSSFRGARALGLRRLVRERLFDRLREPEGVGRRAVSVRGYASLGLPDRGALATPVERALTPARGRAPRPGRRPARGSRGCAGSSGTARTPAGGASSGTSSAGRRRGSPCRCRPSCARWRRGAASGSTGSAGRGCSAAGDDLGAALGEDDALGLELGQGGGDAGRGAGQVAGDGRALAVGVFDRGAGGVGRVVEALDLVLAIAEELAQLLDLALGGVGLALVARAAELLRDLSICCVIWRASAISSARVRSMAARVSRSALRRSSRPFTSSCIPDRPFFCFSRSSSMRRISTSIDESSSKDAICSRMLTSRSAPCSTSSDDVGPPGLEPGTTRL